MWEQSVTMARHPLLWLSLLLASHIHYAAATFWTATSYIAVSKSVSQISSGCTLDSCFRTRTSHISLVSTATPTAASTISRSSSTRRSSDITIVYVYVDAAQVPLQDLVTTRVPISLDSSPNYYVPIVYTAPASCPTPFTFTSHTRVFIPSEVTKQYTPISTATRIVTGSTTTVTYSTLYLPTSNGAMSLPTTMTSVNPTDNYIYSVYLRHCRNPSPTGSSRSGSGTFDDDVNNPFSESGMSLCSSLAGTSLGRCTSVQVWVIVIATILPLLFILGFVESYFWFRRLMLGKSALRVGTVCWCLLMIWVVLFTRITPTRKPEEQQVLKERWKGMSAGTRWKLWWKWGFRWAYPVELLGPDPKGGSGAAAAVPEAGPHGGQVTAYGGQAPGSGGGQVLYGTPMGYPPNGAYAPEKTQIQLDPTQGQQPVYQQAPYGVYGMPQGYPAAGAPIMFMGQQYVPVQVVNPHYSVSTLSTVPGQIPSPVPYPPQAPSPAQTLVQDQQAGQVQQVSPAAHSVQSVQPSHELGDTERAPGTSQPPAEGRP